MGEVNISKEDILEIIKDFEAVKSKVYLRLVRNPGVDDPYLIPVEWDPDIYKEMYIAPFEGDSFKILVPVRKSVVKNIWSKDISQDDLLEIAETNMFRDLKPVVISPVDFVSAEVIELDDVEEFEKDAPVCISVQGISGGAVTVELPGVMHKVASKLEEDFVFGFTSMHEVMCHPVSILDDAFDVQSISTVLNAVIDEQTPTNEILSRKIYRYIWEDDKIVMVDVIEEDIKEE